MTSTSPDVRPTSATSLTGLLARARVFVRAQSDTAAVGRMASAAFIIRVASAAIAFASQPLLARWMGAHEFGVYVYVWTWVLMIGGFADLGFGTTAQRFAAEYRDGSDMARLRGFLRGSRMLAIAFGAALGMAGLGVVAILSPRLETTTPLVLACLCLPVYALVVVQDGIARSYDAVNLALVPPYIVRPVLILALVFATHASGLVAADATLAMISATLATWVIAAGQTALVNRRIARHVPPGTPTYAFGIWLRASLPVVAMSGFYLLLTSTDVLVLHHFRGPEDVARYYAAAKTLALVAFVYFAVSAAVGQKFADYHVANDRDRLRVFLRRAVHLTFWPSLAATVFLLAAGKPILWLFGPEFTDAYPVMWILSAGLLARAAVGPAERLLNMLDEQRRCALVYAGAAAFNIAAALLLVPRFGMYGAAAAMAAALVVESILLFAVAKRRLGLHPFIWSR